MLNTRLCSSCRRTYNEVVEPGVCIKKISLVGGENIREVDDIISSCEVFLLALNMRLFSFVATRIIFP